MRENPVQSVWKPVLGALGAASVFLALVGNLVFSPDSQSKPGSQSKKAGSATGVPLAATSAAQSLDPPRANCDTRADWEPGPFLAEAAEPSPVPPPELAKSEQEPRAEPAAELTRVAEQAPQAELQPKTELHPKADEAVVTLPVESPIVPPESVPPLERALPGEPATDPSVADVRAETESALPDDVRAQHADTVAVGEPSPVFVPLKLSHRDRKVLRKVAHLEKKKKRFEENGRSIVWK
jgi:hypothetical protein